MLLPTFFLLATLSHSNWPKYCGNLAMSGVADSGGAISPVTAEALTCRWRVKLSGAVASSPTVVNDSVYVGDWSGNEWALDADSGDVQANAYLGETNAPQCDPAVLGVTSAAAYDNGTLYVAGGDGNFYALDASTLAVKWQQLLGDNSAHGGYYGWCSPAVVTPFVFQGVSSDCDGPFVPGRVVAMSVDDGTIVHDEYLVWADGVHDVEGSGVWSSPAVDLDNNAVFVTTASAPQYADGFAYSIVRLDLNTLGAIDSWKVPPSETPDADWGSSPTLFRDANGTAMVGAGQKDGHYYAFRRDNLAAGPVWSTTLATGGACPQCGDGVLSTAAFDGKRLYVGAGKLPGGDFAYTGSISALDPATGAVLWQAFVDAPVIAPVSYANRVVFATAGQRAYALDADSGEILWSFETAAACVGGVAITDRGIFFGDLSGTLYAFGVTDPGEHAHAAVR